jgi:hypothetical protein
MDMIKKAFAMFGDFLQMIMDLGIKLLAVGVILQILFGSAVPFMHLDVVGNVTAFVGALGEKGLVGLVALAVLFWAWNKK